MTSDTELARWQGQTDAHMAENSRRLDGINGSITSIERDVAQVRVEVGGITTKVASYSALGAVLGAGLVSFLVALLTRGL